MDQVHFQIFLYSNGQNYTKPNNCSDCWHTPNYTSANKTTVIGVPWATNQFGTTTRAAIKMWGRHAATNNWIGDGVVTGDAGCPGWAGGAVNLCTYYGLSLIHI